MNAVSVLQHALVEQQLLSRGHITALLAWRAYHPAPLAERIYRSGSLLDTVLVRLWSSMGAVDATLDLLAGKPPPAVLGAVSRQLADKHRVVPLRIDRARLIVAMLDPSDTSAIERITFFSGLAVEPRAARARVLFQALHDAYGSALLLPDAGFLTEFARAHDPATAAVSIDDGEALLPPPRFAVALPSALNAGPVAAVFASAAAVAHDTGDVVSDPSGDDPTMRVDNRAPSPLKRGMSAVTGGATVANDDTGFAAFILKDGRPSSTPALKKPASTRKLDEALAHLRHTMPTSMLQARDSLPPQVLRLLVPPFRSAVLLLVRGDVAVGWDGKTPTRGCAELRDVLLPLTAESVLKRARSFKRVAPGDAADPTVTERLLFRAVGGPPPLSFAVVPIVVGERVAALLYVDSDQRNIDDRLIDGARRVGTTLADGLAPFVRDEALFAVPSSALTPIAPKR